MGINLYSKTANVLILLSLTLLVGCRDSRPDRVPVSGQVLIDGQPLTQGYIRLIAKNARPSGGRIGPDGHFQLGCFEKDDGAVLGTHKVTVSATEQLSSTSQRWLVPPKYGNPETSGLTATIDGPTDSLKIELSWEGGAPYVEHYDAGE